MENNKNDNNIKFEKLTLHYKYLIVIVSILLSGMIILTTYNQTEFVAQVSFASTITSIILSVVAIWLSISGERTTNDIKSKISDSAERLSLTTKEIEILNNNHKKTMDTQLSELKNVQEQLTHITQSINNVEKQVSYMYDNNAASLNFSDGKMDTTQRVRLFQNIFLWATSNDYNKEYIFCKMTEIIINKHKNHIPFYFDEITNLLTYNININNCWHSINTYWGIINALLAASVFDDVDALNSILELINKKLYPNSDNNQQTI